jgi:hypothetical protein
LLLGRHAEQHAFGTHVPVESLDISNGEAQFDFSRWILVRSRVESEDVVFTPMVSPRLRGAPFAPLRRTPD